MVNFIIFLVSYNATILDEYGNSGRQEFDTGEEIRCASKSKLPQQPNTLWYITYPIVQLLILPLKTTFFQNPAKILIIKPQLGMKPPFKMYLQCSLYGDASAPIIIYNSIITILSERLILFTFGVTLRRSSKIFI